MILVSGKVGAENRGAIDGEAREIVLNAFKTPNGHPDPFDAALKSYKRKYPHISSEIAGYAVAHIISTAGL